MFQNDYCSDLAKPGCAGAKCANASTRCDIRDGQDNYKQGFDLGSQIHDPDYQNFIFVNVHMIVVRG